MGLGHSPNILTTGLVLAVDPGNAKSYSGSGTTWTDLSTNARALTLTNSPTFNYSGGGSFTLNGTNQYATFNTVVVSSNLTIISWIKTTSTDATSSAAYTPAQPIIGDILNSAWYSFGIHNGKVRYINARNSGTWASYDSTATVNDGNWHQVVVTHNKLTDDIIFYIDGVYDSTYNNYVAGANDYWGGSKMGANRIGTAYGTLDFFTGSLGPTFIYDALLTAEQISNHYNALRQRVATPSFNSAGAVLYFDVANTSCYPGSGTTLTDLSGYGNNGTLINGPTYNSSNGGSIVLDGTNDYIEVATSTTLNVQFNHSLSIWFYQTGATVGYAGIVWKGTSDADDQYCVLLGAARTDVYIDIGNSSGPYINPSITAISLNTWYNLTYTQSRVAGSSTLLLYINGVKQTTTTVAPTQGVNINTTSFKIGYPRLGGSYFPSRIAHHILYNRTLSDLEVMRNFEALRGRFGV
jgi:hypothetical protein